jgi:hypothetical protein
MSPNAGGEGELRGLSRVSTEFRRYGIPRNFLTSEEISAQFRRNSAKFREIPRNFAGIGPEITSVFRGMPKCHFRGHPRSEPMSTAVRRSPNKLCRSNSIVNLWISLSHSGISLHMWIPFHRGTLTRPLSNLPFPSPQ